MSVVSGAESARLFVVLDDAPWVVSGGVVAGRVEVVSPRAASLPRIAVRASFRIASEGLSAARVTSTRDFGAGVDVPAGTFDLPFSLPLPLSPPTVSDASTVEWRIEALTPSGVADAIEIAVTPPTLVAVLDGATGGGGYRVAPHNGRLAATVAAGGTWGAHVAALIARDNRPVWRPTIEGERTGAEGVLVTALGHSPTVAVVPNCESVRWELSRTLVVDGHPPERTVVRRETTLSVSGRAEWRPYIAGSELPSFDLHGVSVRWELSARGTSGAVTEPIVVLPIDMGEPPPASSNMAAKVRKLAAAHRRR